MKLSAKDYVCLASPTELAVLRASRPAHSKEIIDQVWRLIVIEAQADFVKFQLSSVDEEAFSGGYQATQGNCWEKTISWDIFLSDALADLFKYEPVCVWNKALQMAAIFRDNQVAIRAACAQ